MFPLKSVLQQRAKVDGMINGGKKKSKTGYPAGSARKACDF